MHVLILSSWGAPSATSAPSIRWNKLHMGQPRHLTLYYTGNMLTCTTVPHILQEREYNGQMVFKPVNQQSKNVTYMY